jgi:hypothetical protein
MAFSAAPDFKNRTPFAFEPAFMTDEDGAPLFVPIVKATLEVAADGSLQVAPEQQPVKLAGEHWGEPDVSSYRYEPECAFVKPSTDVVVVGHAYPPRVGATEVLAGIRIGALQKVVRVTGDRYWVKRAVGTVAMSDPAPFERIPLIYERAFGGWDRHDEDVAQHGFEARNPVGMGFRVRWHETEQAVPVPNIEDPTQPLRAFEDRPAPAGLGFVSPHWVPRAQLAGTYDAAWLRERSPLLARDFDRRFFNAASNGLVTPAYVRGDEPVTVANASPRGQLNFHLPGLAPPVIETALRDGREERLATSLDTVIVDTDVHQLILIWRAHIAIKDVPRDVRGVVVTMDRDLAAGQEL